jgi:hypothetical protein
MPATGPQYNTYQIPELVLSDTFNEWYTLTNNDIINKLNRLKAYTVGTTGDGISAGIADDGTLNIEIDSTVKKDMNFDGRVVFNGAVTTINSQEITIDDYNMVLGATASGASPAGISAAGGGGLLIRVKESPTGVTASWLYKVVPVDGINNLDANYFESSEHILVEAGKRFLSGDQKILLGNTTDSEAIQISFENTDLVSPAGGVTGSYKDIVFRYAGTSAGSLAGSTLEAFRISDDGRVKFVSGVHHKRITQNAHGLTFGHVVYLPTDSSGYTAGIATNRTTAEVIGVVSNVISGNTFDIQFGGEIIGNFGGVLQTGEGPNLNVGSAYFLSTTEAGKLTGSAPTTGGHIRKPVMVALEADKALIVNYLGGELVDAAEAAAQGASNQVTFTQIGHELEVGDVIRWDTGSTNDNYHYGMYVKAEANNEEKAESLGILIETPANNDVDQFKVATTGYVTGINGLLQGEGLSAGAVYYLSSNSAGNTTDASLTLTPPNTIGFVEKPMFFATSNTSGFVYNYRGSVNTGVVGDDTDVAPEVLGRTFVPIDGPAKSLGIWYREDADRDHGDSSTYREQHKNSGILMTDISHDYVGTNIGKRMASVFHVAINGNTASNPIMLNREGLAHVWDNNIHPAPYEVTSFPNDSGYAMASGMDEYNTHRWRDSRDLDTYPSSGSVPIVSDQLNLVGVGARMANIDYDFNRVTIPSNATHALLTVFTNVNTSLNQWTTTYAAKYDKELIEGDGSGWIHKGNFCTHLDPNTVTIEEEESTTIVVPIDPDAEGSHFMFAVISNWESLTEEGAWDTSNKGVHSETLKVTIEGFYVQDPTVLLPKPFGSYRNLLINGNFDIWQRGTTFGNSTDDTGTLTNSLADLEVVKTNPYVSPTAQKGGSQNDSSIIKDQAYTADRWRIRNRADDTYYIKRKEFDWSDSSSVLPSGAAPSKYYIEHSIKETSANNQGLCQRIEDITSLNDEQVTLSFYYKRVDPDSAGAIAGSNVSRLKTTLRPFVDGTGSGLQSDTSESDGGPWSATATEFDISSLVQTGVTVNLNDTWQKYTHTFTIPSIVGKFCDGGAGITAGKGFWQLEIEPSFEQSTNGWKGSVHIAQVQLEKGRRDTQFDRLPQETVLQRCQRYFQKSLDLDDVPGCDYYTLGQGAVQTAVPGVAYGTTGFPYVADDAVIAGENSTGHRGFNMRGVINGSVRDLSIGPEITYHTSMRDTPEVMVYSPDNGARGYAYFSRPLYNASGNTQYCKSANITVSWLEGIGKNNTCVMAVYWDSQTPIAWDDGGNLPVNEGEPLHGQDGDAQDHASQCAFYWTADAEI